MATTALGESRRLCTVTIASIWAVTSPISAWAAPVLIEPAVEARFVATTNINVGDNVAQQQGDLILEVRPSLSVRSRGAGLTIDGSIGLAATHYSRSNQADRILPDGKIVLNAALIERALFLDAGFSAVRAAPNPFGLQGEFESINSSSTTVYRFSPYLDRDLSPSLRAQARAEFVQTNGFGDDPAASAVRNSRTYKNNARIDQRPLPLGLNAEVRSERTVYPSVDVTAFESKAGRIGMSFAPLVEVEVGAFVGREKTLTPYEDRVDSRRGGLLRWKPTDRTTLEAEGGRRFFGSDWNVVARHRRPGFAISASTSRTLTAAPFEGTIDSLSRLFDSMLITRIPNADERASMVRDLVNSLGFGTDPLRQTEFFAQQAQIQQRNYASLALNGPRNTVSLGTFYARNLALQSAILAGFDLGQARQYGVQFDLSHRLDPEWNGNIGYARSNLYGLGSTLGTFSKQATVRADLIHSSSRRTALTMGVRRNIYTSNTGASNETAAYAGMRLRF